MSDAPRRAGARSLTAISRSGLANRLRLLVSARALAEASGRAFQMVWPRTRACAAAFGELFVGDWPVIDIDAFDAEAWARYWVAGWPAGRPPVPLDDPRPHVTIFANNWLLRPGDAGTPPGLVARYAELLARLEPIPPLAARIDRFRARHFRPTMIGVHLRRGDYVRHRPDLAGNTPEAVAAVEGFLRRAPEAGILLSTDDGAVDQETGHVRREGVVERFAAHFGDRVVLTAPRSLDRRTTEGVQDALVDLLLLRATDMVVGTAQSSFSELAVFGRPVPHRLVGGGLPGYRPLDGLLRLSGTKWVVGRLFQALYGYERPFPYAWRFLVKAARGRVRRLARRP